jgi:hypothetical protein
MIWPVRGKLAQCTVQQQHSGGVLGCEVHKVGNMVEGYNSQVLSRI